MCTYASVSMCTPRAVPKILYSPSPPFFWASPHFDSAHTYSLSFSRFLPLSLTKPQDSVLIYIGLTPGAPFASAIFSKCSPWRGRVVFGDPTDDNQSRIHSLEATARCVSDSERLGERSFGNEKDGDARLERKHVVRQRRERRRARALFGAHLSPRWSRVFPCPHYPDLRAFPVKVKPHEC